MKQTRIFVLFLLMFIMAATVGAEERKTGFLSGRLMIKNGEPLVGGMAFLFNHAAGPPPSPEKYWRVPDEIVPCREIDRSLRVEHVDGRGPQGRGVRGRSERLTCVSANEGRVDGHFHVMPGQALNHRDHLSK